MADLPDVHDLTALEQGRLVRRGEVTPAELAEHYLERAHRIDEDPDRTVGAFVTLTDERALDRARQLAAAGRPEDASPLWGVPTAIKDLNLTAGVRTTFGSPVFADFVPDVSDGVTLDLEAAGLISLGKTTTPEFGSPCYTEPEGRAPAVTPWDRTRMAGGSSGGAAAAVAAGLVPLAQGSDGGGSIRIPASCCGLFGLKPTRGRISGHPVYGDPVGVATAGPITRTVRDAAAMLDVLAGRRAGDPAWAPPPRGTFLDACDREPRTLRIARFTTPVIADAPVDEACLRAVVDASRTLADLGHEVVDVAVPLPPEAVPEFETCWAVLTALTVVPQEQQHLLRPLTRWLSERGRAVSGPEFGLAIAAMRRFAAGALTALAPYDAVLTPTLAQPPLPVGALRDDADPAADFEAQKAFTPWTSAWNVTGMPAASLPLGWTDGGLPVGVMLAARPAEEELLLSLCAQVEAATPWGAPEAAGMVMATRHTADLSVDELSQSRALMDLAFNRFSDEDWEHALGGSHALVLDGDRVIAHGSLVMRRLLTGERSLRTGYVEAVAVHPDHQRRGLGGLVMDALESLAPAYDVLALSASEAGALLYESRGWQPWRGPTWVLGPHGRARTEDDDGAVYVLGAGHLDLDADLACDWREGEVW